MHRLERTNKINQRQDRYDKKKYDRKRKKLREDLFIGEKVYVLAERIKKKTHVENFTHNQRKTLAILTKIVFLL